MPLKSVDGCIWVQGQWWVNEIEDFRFFQKGKQVLVVIKLIKIELENEWKQ